MNPDVFITIVFVGIAVLGALVPLMFVLPGARRESARVARRDPRRLEKQSETVGRDGSVH